MKNTKKPQILSLSTEEVKLIEVLKEEKSPTELAENTTIPRTTINYILKDLVARGIITKIKHGKRFSYKVSDKEKLTKLNDEVRSFFDPSLSVIGIPSFSGLRAYKGIDAIISLHEKLMYEEPKYSRVKVIQPNKSFLNMFDTASVEQIIALNKAISGSNIILDGIIEEDAYQIYEDYWKVDPEGYGKLNKTFLNRSTAYVTVQKNFISFENELWIYFDSVVIVNYKEKVAVQITNSETQGLLAALYDTLKATGIKIDHTKEISKREK